MLPQDRVVTKAAKVIGRSVDKDGNVSGKQLNNLILDTRLYDVKVPDRSIKRLADNRIVVKYTHMWTSMATATVL